jgi:hypothetical protein
VTNVTIKIYIYIFAKNTGENIGVLYNKILLLQIIDLHTVFSNKNAKFSPENW